MIARATGGSCFATFSATDPAIDLAERAALEALADAGHHFEAPPNAPPPDRDPSEPAAQARRSGAIAAGIRTIIASSKGAVGPLFERGDTDRKAECAALSPHGYLCEHLRRRLGLGETTAVVAACATSMAALHLAWREIMEGRERRILVIAVESAMLPLFVHSYQRLGVLAPTSPVAAHVARPLDTARAGFTLCECAAAVILESAASAPAARIKATLHGALIGAEPHDAVRAPERFDTLIRLVRALAPRDGRAIALLHPHATGTPGNDERELAALAEALGPDRAAAAQIYASKGALGHPLGAAGLVNVALGCSFARIGKRPPMPWLDSPIDSPFPLTRDAATLAPGPQLAVAAGFGGHVGAVCFEA